MEILMLVAYLAAGTALYGVILAIYRITLHPLARFPGPKLAAATGWYEFYYDVIRIGTFVYKVEEMHKQYGPIVRINPHEIVIDDADFYNQIYNTRPAEKWTLQIAGVGIDGKLLYRVREFKELTCSLQARTSRPGAMNCTGTAANHSIPSSHAWALTALSLRSSTTLK
ncbi:uncharacterized protein DSM5745_09546 [Aspergillus mulundensis]|uniref:Cytochrome P450 n=1 Tax=Aspergillus mulundensis TaxID=1810919 RepID=A0A3D8QVK4_9EURO|nr:hypothetical protein DSM5745_09546 [Aspergillus mulundensis]RDW65807.1 hypothetical protein DSM5745_09546 [Aspergillus mulundensis]